MGVPCKGRMGMQRSREGRKVAPWKQRLPGSCWALSGGFESCLRVSRVKCVWISSSKLRCRGRALFLCHLSSLILILSLHSLCHSHSGCPLLPCVVLQVGFSEPKGGGLQREQLPSCQWSTKMDPECPGSHLPDCVCTWRRTIPLAYLWWHPDFSCAHITAWWLLLLEPWPCGGQRPTEPRMKTAVTFRTKLAWIRMKCGKPSLICIDDPNPHLHQRFAGAEGSASTSPALAWI